MTRRGRITRRHILRGAAWSAATAAAAPYVLTSAALGAAAVSAAAERINVACIGVRGRGGRLLRTLLDDPAVQVAAICDVDARVLRQALNRARGPYGQCARGGSFRGIEGFGDFREVCARSDVDAVVIATPDHTHALIALEAIRAGKDVYVEAPLSHTIREGRVVADAARRHGRIVQVGSQRRSHWRQHLACQLVREGRIGRLLRAEVQVPLRPAQPLPWSAQPVPPELDYELWLGPAPHADYTRGRCHHNFRFIRDYAGGELTTSGAHWLDLAQWGLGADDGGPVAVEGSGQAWPTGLYDAFCRFRVEWTYPGGAKLVCTSSAEGREALRFIGTDGWIDAATLQAHPPSILQNLPEDGRIALYPAGRSHMLSFLDGVRTRRQPTAPAEVGHRSATVCHLGNIALTLGRPLRWDPSVECFPADSAADAMTWRPYRSPWTL